MLKLMIKPQQQDYGASEIEFQIRCGGRVEQTNKITIINIIAMTVTTTRSTIILVTIVTIIAYLDILTFLWLVQLLLELFLQL